MTSSGRLNLPQAYKTSELVMYTFHSLITQVHNTKKRGENMQIQMQEVAITRRQSKRTPNVLQRNTRMIPGHTSLKCYMFLFLCSLTMYFNILSFFYHRL